MQITLEPRIEYMLRVEAERKGVAAEEYAKELLEEHFLGIVRVGQQNVGAGNAELKPLIVLEGSAPRLTKEELY